MQYLPHTQRQQHPFPVSTITRLDGTGVAMLVASRGRASLSSGWSRARGKLLSSRVSAVASCGSFSASPSTIARGRSSSCAAAVEVVTSAQGRRVPLALAAAAAAAAAIATTAFVVASEDSSHMILLPEVVSSLREVVGADHVSTDDSA